MKFKMRGSELFRVLRFLDFPGVSEVRIQAIPGEINFSGIGVGGPFIKIRLLNPCKIPGSVYFPLQKLGFLDRVPLSKAGKYTLEQRGNRLFIEDNDFSYGFGVTSVSLMEMQKEPCESFFTWGPQESLKFVRDKLMRLNRFGTTAIGVTKEGYLEYLAMDSCMAAGLIPGSKGGDYTLPSSMESYLKGLSSAFPAEQLMRVSLEEDYTVFEFVHEKFWGFIAIRAWPWNGRCNFFRKFTSPMDGYSEIVFSRSQLIKAVRGIKALYKPSYDYIKFAHLDIDVPHQGAEISCPDGPARFSCGIITAESRVNIKLLLNADRLLACLELSTDKNVSIRVKDPVSAVYFDDIREGMAGVLMPVKP